MRLITYQSEVVLKILQRKEIYRAKPSISFKLPYSWLIEMTKMNCDCPVFAVVKGRKQLSAGRVSASVRLELDVPDEMVKLTEFNVWADFLYSSKFSKPHQFRKLKADYHEITQAKYDEIIKDISTQKPLEDYKYPQALIEYIDPKWLVSYKKSHNTNKKLSSVEKLFNLFRK